MYKVIETKVCDDNASRNARGRIESMGLACIQLAVHCIIIERSPQLSKPDDTRSCTIATEVLAFPRAVSRGLDLCLDRSDQGYSSADIQESSTIAWLDSVEVSRLRSHSCLRFGGRLGNG